MKPSALIASAFVGLALLCLISIGCSPFAATAPKGFAAYKGHNPYRAVSPDGVIFRVRSEPNEPHADLAFWKEALKKRMLDAGYTFRSESDIAASNLPGYVLELTAPLGSQDFTYLVAVFEHDDDLIIVEATGEVVKFEAHRAALLDAVKALEF